MRPPWLVQRVDRRDPNHTLREDAVGIDRHFRFDYMGSAEFEFGELPRALKVMREHIATLKIVKIPPPVKGVKQLWFLGDPKYLPQAVELLVDQLKPLPKMYLKEATHMRQSLLIENVCGWPRHDAWWALDVGCPWLVFVQKEDAARWLKDLKDNEK